MRARLSEITSNATLALETRVSDESRSVLKSIGQLGHDMVPIFVIADYAYNTSYPVLSVNSFVQLVEIVTEQVFCMTAEEKILTDISFNDVHGKWSVRFCVGRPDDADVRLMVDSVLVAGEKPAIIYVRNQNVPSSFVCVLSLGSTEMY